MLDLKEISDVKLLILINDKSEELSLIKEEYLSRFKILDCYLPGGNADTSGLKHHLKDYKLFIKWSGTTGTVGNTRILVKPETLEEVKQIIIDKFGKEVFYN